MQTLLIYRLSDALSRLYREQFRTSKVNLCLWKLVLKSFRKFVCLKVRISVQLAPSPSGFSSQVPQTDVATFWKNISKKLELRNSGKYQVSSRKNTFENRPNALHAVFGWHKGILFLNLDFCNKNSSHPCQPHSSVWQHCSSLTSLRHCGVQTRLLWEKKTWKKICNVIFVLIVSDCRLRLSLLWGRYPLLGLLKVAQTSPEIYIFRKIAKTIFLFWERMKLLETKSI